MGLTHLWEAPRGTLGSPWRENLRFRVQFQMRTSGHGDCRCNQRGLTTWRLDLPEAPRAVHETSALTREEPHRNLEKTGDSSPTRAEALFLCGSLEKIPPSFLSLKGPDSLKATQEVLPTFRSALERNTRVLPQPKKSLLPPSSSRGGSTSYFVRGIPSFP